MFNKNRNRKHPHVNMPGDCNARFNYSTDLDIRTIFLLDIDSFDVQRLQQSWMIGKPRIVANAKCRIVSVSKEAKEWGINRTQTPYVRDAQALYPGVIVIYLPSRPKGRPDTIGAKEATEEIKWTILKGLLRQGLTEGQDFVLQVNGADEFYVDLTGYLTRRANQDSWFRQECHKMFNSDSTLYIYSDECRGVPGIQYMTQKMRKLMTVASFEGNQQQLKEKRLILGALIADNVSQFLRFETGYTSSIGVASNKLVAKIASGRHKPQAITIVSPLGFYNFADQVKLMDVPGLGGHIGSLLDYKFQLSTMGDLRYATHYDISACIMDCMNHLCWKEAEEKATEALNNVNGICVDPVIPLEYSKTVTSDFKIDEDKKRITRARLIHYLANDVSGEFADKLKFEAYWHGRLANKIKLTIYSPGMDSITAISNEEQPENVTGQGLYEDLEFDPHPSLWHRRMVVSEIKIVANCWRNV